MPDGEKNLTALCDGDPLARALSRLRPAVSGIDPSKLLYEAGRQAQARSLMMWRCAFAAQTLLVFAVVAWFAGAFSALENVPHADYAARQTSPLVAQKVPDSVVDVTPRIETAPRPRPSPIPREYYAPEPVEGFASHRSIDEPAPQEIVDRLRRRNEVIAAGLDDILPKHLNGQGPSDWRRPFGTDVYAVPKRDDSPK